MTGMKSEGFKGLALKEGDCFSEFYFNCINKLQNSNIIYDENNLWKGMTLFSFARLLSQPTAF